MIPALTWLGRNARWVLAVGSIIALLMPHLAAFSRPALPYLVCLVLGMSMARVDLPDIARNAFKPKFLKDMGLATALLMPVTGVVHLAFARGFGLAEADVEALVYLAATPPIASAAGLCLILGYDARRALEITLAATILTPVIGPIMVALMIPDAAGVSSLDLAWRLARMILGGILVGLMIRATVGPARIDGNKAVFDGLSAIAMVMFIFPLFDGVLETILSDPGRALWVLALASLFNLGINAAVRQIAFRAPEPRRGALGLIWGNRTIALYLAALPPDPQFTLFCALYQFPMYFTPLIFAPRQRTSRKAPPA